MRTRAAQAAAKAGVLVSDVITEVNGKDTHSEPSLDLLGAIRDKAAPVKLRVMRYVHK